MQLGSVSIEEHIHGDTRWVAIRARGAEWSWLTPTDALVLASALGGNLQGKHRPLQKRPRWYQAQPIDDPDSATSLDRIRKGLPEGHWVSNDTFRSLGRSLLDLMRSPCRA